MKKVRVGFGILFLASLVGCVSTQVGNENLTDQNIAKLQKGKTTIYEAIALFGKPLSTTNNANGTTALAWFSLVSSASPSAANFIPIIGPFVGKIEAQGHSQMLVLVFDSNGVLTTSSNANTDTNITSSPFGGTAVQTNSSGGAKPQQ